MTVLHFLMGDKTRRQSSQGWDGSVDQTRVAFEHVLFVMHQHITYNIIIYIYIYSYIHIYIPGITRALVVRAQIIVMMLAATDVVNVLCNACLLRIFNPFQEYIRPESSQPRPTIMHKKNA